MPTIALLEPEIPPNTGNIIRLCANTGADLHLIKPLGFELEDKRMRRAGLDYHEFADVALHESYEEFESAMQGRRIFYCSTHGEQDHTGPNYQDNDIFLFGPETRGIPKNILNEHLDTTIRIPMLPNSRSLNLSNATAIILYEALRQAEFLNLK